MMINACDTEDCVGHQQAGGGGRLFGRIDRHTGWSIHPSRTEEQLNLMNTENERTHGRDRAYGNHFINIDGNGILVKAAKGVIRNHNQSSRLGNAGVR